MGKRKLRQTGAVLALSLVMVSCGGDSGARVVDSSGPGDNTTVAGGSAPVDDSVVALDAAVQQVLALPLAERMAKANDAERGFEMELAAFSGLADAMGGGDQLAAAFDSTAQQTRGDHLRSVP